MRIVILQSNYIPWKGYFDLLGAADLFIVYDSVQYTKNDWRNRNKIMTPGGPLWLTIPVKTSGQFGQPIDEVEVNDGRWASKHWRSIEQSYGKTPFFAEYAESWRNRFEHAADLSALHDINLLFLRGCAEDLGLATEITVDRDHLPLEGDPTERLVALCAATGATTYLTGPAALDYLRTDLFVEAGIDLEVIDYSGYSEYPQRSKEFEHGVSVLDLLANVGPDAASHLLKRVSPVAA